MLICPQCQFENPNPNKFCQRCGTSLTQKVCAECGTNVALSREQCPNCGAKTGTVWWAIISRDLSTFLPGPYLDQEQRYQLLEPLPPPQEITEVQVRVLDCQPFQLSPLEAGAESMTTILIPAIAKTYLAFESQFYQALPAIHDAWQQDGIQVILIADRSNWPKLTDLWRDNKAMPLQVLHWLFETTQLWAALEPWHCRYSLLELSNLRVDKDGVLALQRLYNDTIEHLTLKDLGQGWQRLFQESQRTQFGSLLQLLKDLQNGDIQTIEDLRSRLEAVSAELQADESPTLPPDTAAAELELAIIKTEVAATPIEALPPVFQPDESQDSPTESDIPTLVLPMQLISLEDAGKTDVGRQREHNEDFFSIETTINKFESPHERSFQTRGLYILCDGMGGHAGGEVASNLAVSKLKQYFQTHWQEELPSEDTIREGVRLANQAIYDMNQQDARSGVARMGTTLVMVLLQDTKVAVVHVGDSRLYRISPQVGLEQVTVDHEVGQREMSRGIEQEIAYARPDAYQLTQALGPRDENFINPGVQFLQLNEDTLLLLASDGLTDNDLLENNWHTHLEPLLKTEASLKHGVSNLIDLANQVNGHDNITAVVIRARVHLNGAGTGVP